MNITYSLANLQEFLVLLNCLLVLSEVVKEDPSGIVGTTLVSRFSGPLASESEDIIILEALLGGYTVI